MSVKIFSYPNNNRVKKSLVASQYNGVAVETEVVDLSKGEHKGDKFAKASPFGQVPVCLVNGDNEGLFESNSILRYVAREGEKTFPLYGKNHLEASRIDAFLDVAVTYESLIAHWIYPILGYLPLNEGNLEFSKKYVKNIFLGLNKHLAGKDFLVGDSVTIADIGLTCSLVGAFTLCFDKEYLADVPEFVRWFRQNIARPEFHKVIGDFQLLADK